MTFQEAFNSGCRFKLPEGYLGLWGNWPDGWWWKKFDKDTIDIFDEIDNKFVRKIYIEDIESTYENTLMIQYLESNDWYLHPHDVHNMNFRNKLEDLINE